MLVLGKGGIAFHLSWPIITYPISILSKGDKMKTKTSILILFSLCICNIINAKSDSNVYIAYLGEKKHDDHRLTVLSHIDLLASVVGSKEQAAKLMIHNYKYGFSGFSAKLTEAQAEKLAAAPDVIHLLRDRPYKTQGVKAPEYLGLTNQLPSNIIERTKKGEDIIIGVIDTGIWANNSRGIFSDEGYGPIPAKWKGKCESVGTFNASEQCNKKVIGAYWHRRGATANGFLSNDTITDETTSPLDFHGHGTVCASLAAGSEVKNVTYLNREYGDFQGIAPRARLAIYKACFRIRPDAPKTDDCLASDVIEAFDQAIHDGVDVISASIGPQLTGTDDLDNYLNFASYHAVASGISVVSAAGNMGPEYKSLGNTSPWHITVAAARVDEDVVANITLGNNITVESTPLSGRQDIGFKKVVMLGNSVLEGWNFPNNNATLKQMVNGKVVFLNKYSARDAKTEHEYSNTMALSRSASNLGIVGLIIEVNPTSSIQYQFEVYKNVVYAVEKEVARQIEDYIRVTPDAMVNLGKPILKEGPSVRTKMEWYSSRGPSPRTPTILKPDIVAPAFGLLSAATGKPRTSFVADNGFRTMSGTSAATPIVAGLVALLRSDHPDWSPAALKSALVTTGQNLDRYGEAILSPFSKTGVAGPLDLGGGMADVNAASDPGLVYDMQPNDYANYLCGTGYLIQHIRAITRNPFLICPRRMQAIMDVNVPSIGVSGLVTKLVISRTVTNVGPVNSTYRPYIFAPLGTKITTRPKKLKFNAARKQITYKLIIEKIENVDENADGSITWTDGKHHVRSPIVVLS